MLENLLGVTQVVVVLGPHSGAVAERTQTQAEGYKQRKLEAEHVPLLAYILPALLEPLQKLLWPAHLPLLTERRAHLRTP
jgi:hypothetical protein